MRVSISLALSCALAFAGCGDDSNNRLPDAADGARLVVEPPDVTVTITDGQVVTQAYVATVIEVDGTMRDVTAEATFSIAPSYGTFAGPMLSVSGQGAGPTRVTATAEGISGDTGLTVYVRGSVIGPGAPPNARDLFEAATEDPARAPTIRYPSDRILVPPNLGEFDVHWANPAAIANDLFEVAMANEYVDIRLYTTGLEANQPFWTSFQPATWYPIASSRTQLSLTVAGLDTAAPTVKGTTVAQHVDVTNEDTRGGIYYWSTTNASVWRYDVGRPDVPPTAFFDQGSPSSCMGCHALSRDGTKLALTLDGAGGRGAVFDVATKTQLVPAQGSVLPQPYWNFAAFDSTATKLVTIENDGELFLRDMTGAVLAGPVPTLDLNRRVTHPELAPDNAQLVAVEYASGVDYAASSGSIVMRSFDSATNTFGTPVDLVPADAQNGVANWYPSFSPDGQWIVFTRSASGSYDDASSETWAIKADGTMPPILLAAANLPTGNLTNSWARWVPFGQTFGTTNEPIFYLTFSSKREFGVRLAGGQPQIWMVPFFPARAAMGMDPSGAAFRVPFQDVQTSNHIAQWTQSIIQ